MTAATGTYTDFEKLREQAIALRREGLSLRRIRDHLKIYDNDLLHRLVKGEPPPEWTKRPNAKDDLRDRARELHLQGMTYDQIQVEPGCSKSSISLWVRDLPKPRYTDEERQARMNAGLARLRSTQEEDRQETKRVAREAIDALTDREPLVAGVVLYRAEGTEDKTYSRRECLQFINSDPNVITLHLRWLDQPPNRPKEHRAGLPRMPRHLRHRERGAIPSHGGRLVRHSGRRRGTRLTGCPFLPYMPSPVV